MANDAFQTCLDFTLEYEGLYSCVRSDPGNWTSGKVGEGALKGTKYGISAATYPVLDIEDLSRKSAADIYYRDFWTKYECGKLLPCEAMVVFDALVNNGPARAKKWQRDSLPPAPDTIAFIKNFSGKRLTFDKSLHTLWGIFGKGWQARVLACEAKALGMAGGSQALNQAAAMAHSKAVAAKKSVAKSGAIGGVGVVAHNAANGNIILSVALIGSFLILMGLFAWRAAAHSARQKALETEAKAIAPSVTTIIQGPSHISTPATVKSA